MNRATWMRFVGLLALALMLLTASPASLDAKERYAERTGKGCIFCHEQSTGGAVNATGGDGPNGLDSLMTWIRTEPVVVERHQEVSGTC